MKESLLSHLVCPDTHMSLTLEVIEKVDFNIKTGRLISPTGRCFPIEKFIPRFAPDDSYTNTFSFQRREVRRHFDSYRHSYDLQEVSAFFERSSGISKSALTGQLVLDAGCGYGRFLPVISAAGGEVIGIDLSSDSVELAYEWVGQIPGVHLVQADFLRLPFRKSYFDIVFSIGALHQSPNPRESFLACAAKLGYGGKIGVWVYNPEMKRSSDAWRLLTTRLPLRVVYGWCVLNEILFAPLRSLPWGSGIVHRLVPGSGLGTPFWQRVLSDFDDLSPKYAFSYYPDEVCGWFYDAGLVDVIPLERQTAVFGRRITETA
jgi:SAM-dependent methyltransferase